MNDPIIQATDKGKNFYLLLTITEFDSIPILFIAKDDYDDLYLCDCVEFRDKQIWVISKITLNTLMQLIAQKITVLNALKRDKGEKILVTFDYDTGKFTQENIDFNKISNENLPEEGAFAYINGYSEDDNENETIKLSSNSYAPYVDVHQANIVRDATVNLGTV